MADMSGLCELLRSNDVVLISFVSALMADSAIDVVVLDSHTSIVEGSIGILPRRMMVDRENLNAARRLLEEAEIAHGRFA